MPTSYTSLLGLALPVTGELSGTWGDTVNDYITKYLDAAVAGAQTISGSQTAVTLSVTTAGNLSQAGSGSTGSAQYSIINCTGNPGALLTITAPAASKVYLLLNNTSTNQSVKIVGAGPTTGVTVAAAQAALVAWNGSDFELVATTDINSLSGTLATTKGGTGLTSFTSGGAVYATSTSALTTGTLPVASGGTGAVSLTGYVKGSGTSALTASSTVPVSDLSGTLPVTAGGTGQTSFTDGQLLIGNSTGNTLTKATLTQGTGVTITNGNGSITIAATGSGGTVTSVNTSNGPAPINGLTLTGGPITSSGTVTLGGGVNVSTITTGVLPVANGGTGLNAVGSSGNVLTSNGTAWVSQAVAAGGANVQTFSAGGTYTKPPGAKFVYVEMWGAGGGGGSNGSLGGAGGGGGAYTYKMFAAPEVGSTVTVTVGAGGTGAAAGPDASGGKGGTTNFGTLLYAYGGFGASLSVPGGLDGALGGGVYDFSFSAISLNQGTTAVTSARLNAFGFAGPSVPSPVAAGAIVAGVWSGGSGGALLSPTLGPTQGKFGAVSMFAGGGGGGGGRPGNNPGGFGGMGRLYGAPTATSPNPNSAVSYFTMSPSPSPVQYIGSGGGTGGSGPGDVSPTAPINGGPGSTGPGFSGGGGGGSAPPGNTNANGLGGNGGIAGGGGGSGGSPTIATSTGSAGSGGNGYVVVYSWS